MAQLLQNAVYGTAMILAAAVLRRAMKDRLAPEARLALWAVCLFRLLTPAAPESVLSLWRLFVPEAQSVSPLPDAVFTPAVPAVGEPAAPVAAPEFLPAPPRWRRGFPGKCSCPGFGWRRGLGWGFGLCGLTSVRGGRWTVPPRWGGTIPGTPLCPGTSACGRGLWTARR